MEIQDVLKKLRKLQKLYEGAKKINSEGEAENAARAIQHLLTEYNLTMADAEAYKTDDEKAKEYVREDVSGFNYKSIGGKWEMFLLNTICRNYFCRCIRIGTLNHLCIIGQQENVITVKWMKDMLTERFVAFSKDRWKEFKAEQPWERMSKDKFQRSYLIGCAQGLAAKLQEQREQDERDKQLNQEHNTTVTALVRMNDLAVNNAVTKFCGRVGTIHVHINHDSAYGSGYTDGYHTNLNKGIEQGRNHIAGALN